MSVFTPSHQPALWWERALQHGGYVVIAVLSVVTALLVAIDTFTDAFFSTSLLNQHGAINAALAGFLGVGGVTALVGALIGIDNRSLAWNIEKAGWWLAAAGWAGYSGTVIMTFPHALISWGSPLALSLACLLRIFTLILIDRHARAVRTRLGDRTRTAQLPQVRGHTDKEAAGE